MYPCSNQPGTEVPRFPFSCFSSQGETPALACLRAERHKAFEVTVTSLRWHVRESTGNSNATVGPKTNKISTHLFSQLTRSGFSVYSSGTRGFLSNSTPFSPPRCQSAGGEESTADRISLRSPPRAAPSFHGDS